MYDGECENRDDEDLGMEAGRCICKTNVDGRRCDQCKEGYWNMQDDNPDGCEGIDQKNYIPLILAQLKREFIMSYLSCVL